MVVLLFASLAAFALAMLSAVAGFGGGVLLLPVFTALFGLRAAVPMLTITQLSSNGRSEEHTSELQSLDHISYAVFCLDRKSVV